MSSRHYITIYISIIPLVFCF